MSKRLGSPKKKCAVRATARGIVSGARVPSGDAKPSIFQEFAGLVERAKR
jgi:hypothetical protein